MHVYGRSYTRLLNQLLYGCGELNAYLMCPALAGAYQAAQLVSLFQRPAQLHHCYRLTIFEWRLHELKHLSLIHPGMLVSLHCDAIIGV